MSELGSRRCRLRTRSTTQSGRSWTRQAKTCRKGAMGSSASGQPRSEGPSSPRGFLEDGGDGVEHSSMLLGNEVLRELLGGLGYEGGRLPHMAREAFQEGHRAVELLRRGREGVILQGPASRPLQKACCFGDVETPRLLQEQTPMLQRKVDLSALVPG